MWKPWVIKQVSLCLRLFILCTYAGLWEHDLINIQRLVGHSPLAQTIYTPVQGCCRLSICPMQSLEFHLLFLRDVNTAVMELLVMAYALKTSCAKNIIGVIPYFPYSKQCKMRKRGSIVCKLLASMLAKAGMNCHEWLALPFTWLLPVTWICTQETVFHNWVRGLERPNLSTVHFSQRKKISWPFIRFTLNMHACAWQSWWWDDRRGTIIIHRNTSWYSKLAV